MLIIFLSLVASHAEFRRFPAWPLVLSLDKPGLVKTRQSVGHPKKLAQAGIGV
jgi:hypothetical protein